MPLVSVLLAVHDDDAYVGQAIDSVLRQTCGDLELVVVDDASTDDTPELLSRVEDRRVSVLRNEERVGLAASLNRGLEAANGKYVARLDADDVAVPHRLERQLARITNDRRIAIVGSAIVDLDAQGRQGRAHLMPQGSIPLRWHALFSSPFFHPTVLVDRELLDAHGLRYDPSLLESEDYDLWTRLFAFSDGDNLPEPLVLKRVHPGQASQRRREIQESFQRNVALREIARLAPQLDAELAWRIGANTRPSWRGATPFLRLLAAFEGVHGRNRAVRRAAFRALIRTARGRW